MNGGSCKLQMSCEHLKKRGVGVCVQDLWGVFIVGFVGFFSQTMHRAKWANNHLDTLYKWRKYVWIMTFPRSMSWVHQCACVSDNQMNFSSSLEISSPVLFKNEILQYQLDHFSSSQNVTNISLPNSTCLDKAFCLYVPKVTAHFLGRSTWSDYCFLTKQHP